MARARWPPPTLNSIRGSAHLWVCATPCEGPLVIDQQRSSAVLPSGLCMRPIVVCCSTGSLRSRWASVTVAARSTSTSIRNGTKGSPIVSMAAHLQAPVDGDSGTSGSKNFDSGISGARSVLRGPSLMTADTE